MIFKNYEIRFAKYEDIDKIMKFIKDEWSETHILANNKEFFLYENTNEDGTVNFVIVIDLVSDFIVAVHAFYKYGNSPDYFGGLWKAKRTNVPLLGVMLKKFLYDNLQYRSFSSVGSNPNTTIPIQKKLGFVTGKLNHFYILGGREYKIAVINDPKKIIVNEKEKEQFCLLYISDFDALSDFNFQRNFYIKPFKSATYIEKRYFKHPVYNYKVFRLTQGSHKFDSLLICREVVVNQSKVLRIIDFIGEASYLGHLYSALQRLLIDGEYEYIDFYCYGISNEILRDSGFVFRNDQDYNIIPNYFEPFVQQNIDIYFHTTEKEGIRICKGDSDQDRPSKV